MDMDILWAAAARRGCRGADLGGGRADRHTHDSDWLNSSSSSSLAIYSAVTATPGPASASEQIRSSSSAASISDARGEDRVKREGAHRIR